MAASAAGLTSTFGNTLLRLKRRRSQDPVAALAVSSAINSESQAKKSKFDEDTVTFALEGTVETREANDGHFIGQTLLGKTIAERHRSRRQMHQAAKSRVRKEAEVEEVRYRLLQQQRDVELDEKFLKVYEVEQEPLVCEPANIVGSEKEDFVYDFYSVHQHMESSTVYDSSFFERITNIAPLQWESITGILDDCHNEVEFFRDGDEGDEVEEEECDDYVHEHGTEYGDLLSDLAIDGEQGELASSSEEEEEIEEMNDLARSKKCVNSTTAKRPETKDYDTQDEESDINEVDEF